MVGSNYGSGQWSVEYVRKLDTGHLDDDVMFAEGSTYMFAVAVHNKSGDAAHFTAKEFTLEISSETGEPTTTTEPPTTTTTETTTTTTTATSTPGFFIPISIFSIVTLLVIRNRNRKKV
jgi:hypothetical protein